MAIRSEYRRDMQKNELLVYDDSGEKERPNYYEKMLLYNEIAGIYRFSERRLDQHTIFAYDVTGCEALSQLLELHKLNYEHLRGLFHGIIDTVDGGRKFLLDERDYLIHQDYIFIKPESEEIQLCCFPGYNLCLADQFAGLLEYLMNKIDYNDRNAVYAVYTMYMKSKEPGCTFEDFVRILEQNNKDEEYREKEAEALLSKERKRPEAEPKRPAEEQVVSCDTAGQKSIPDEEHSKPDKSWRRYLARFFRQEESKEINAVRQSHGNPAVNIAPEPGGQESERTVLLYRPPGKALFYLEAPDADRTDIYLTDFPFYIGKAGANLSCELKDSAVSRIHAKLMLQDGRVYLEDMNSTNGTFINGIRIPENKRYELKDGDEIMFANQGYRFRMNRK